MKNFVFCAAAVLLTAVTAVFGFSSLRSGSGAAVMFGAGIKADHNSNMISGVSYAPMDRVQRELPNDRTELTADILGSVTIDGTELSFPLKISDLNGDFRLIPMYYDEEECVYMSDMYYKGIHIASVVYKYDPAVHNSLDDCTIITLLFPENSNSYAPQIFIGDIDIYANDIRDINRVYGCCSDEYGYTNLYARSDEEMYVINVSEYGIHSLRYTDAYDDAEALRPFLTVYNDEENYTVPTNYSIEKDSVNSAMKYIPVEDNNEGMQAALDNLYIGDKKITLPCTLNALMKTLGEDSSLGYYYYSTSPKNIDGYDVFLYSGVLRYGGVKVDVDFLIKPDNTIGESQVIKLDFTGESGVSGLRNAEMHMGKLKADDIYGFKYDEEEEYYFLTDYTYNNVKLQGKRCIISYWGENTEKETTE